MTGLPDHNFPAFFEAEDQMKLMGFDVINPARNFDGRTDLPWPVYMSAAVAQVLQADSILFLNGWLFSKGARIEHLVGSALGLEMFDEEAKPVEPEDKYLPQAKKLVFGDRNASYGPPIKDFALQSQCMSSVGMSFGTQPINLLHIPLIMAIVKLCRQHHKEGDDNLVDIAGYALCYKWCVEELNKAEQ